MRGLHRPPKALRTSTFTASCDTEKRLGEEYKCLNLARRHRGLVYIGERMMPDAFRRSIALPIRRY